MSLHSERKCALSAGENDFSAKQEAMQTQRQSPGVGPATTMGFRLAGRPGLRRFQLGFRPAAIGSAAATWISAPARRAPQPSVASMGRLRSIRLSLRFIAPLAIPWG